MWAGQVDPLRCVNGVAVLHDTWYKLRKNTPTWNWIRDESRIIQRVIGNQPTRNPVISTNDFVEQQNIIEEINRDGLSFSYPGFSEQVPAPLDVQGPDVVELNYEQADLRLVLEQLAESLDISILIDPSIDKRISIRTSPDRPLQREDIWPLIRLLTRDAGIFLERVGDVYNARMINSSLPADIIGPDSSVETVNSQVMQITPLTYVSTETAVEALGPVSYTHLTLPTT